MKKYEIKHGKYAKHIIGDVRLHDEIYPDDLGALSNNSFAHIDHSARNLMTISQRRQAMVLKYPTTAIIQSGFQYRLRNTALDTKFHAESEILKIVPRYDGNRLFGEINNITEITIHYLNKETDKISRLVVKKFTEYHSKSNHELIWLPILNDLQPGTVVPKNTIVAISPLHKNGTLAPGREVNVAFLSTKSSAEDSVEVSDELEELATTITYEKRKLVGDNFTFINAFGTIDNPKYFPDIGEKVREDGLLCAIREYNKKDTISGFNKIALMSFCNDNDTPIYVSSGDATVVDIEVFKKELKTNTPQFDEAFEHLDKYAKGCNKFRLDNIKAYEEIEAIDKINRPEDVDNYDNEYAAKMVNYYFLTNQEKVNYVNKKEPITNYEIIFTIKTEYKFGHGKKGTFQSGDKFTVGAVRPKKYMYVDKNGVVADLIAHGGSTNSRTNHSRLYLMYISDASRKLQREIVEIINTEGSFDNDNLIRKLFEELIDFLDFIDSGQNTTFKEVYNDNDIETMRDEIMDIYDTDFRLFIPTTTLIEPLELVRRLDKSKFGPKPEYLYYTDENGVKHYTKEKAFIAPMYMLVLDKLAETISACNSPKRNVFGLPSSTSKANKNTYPWSNTALGILDETTLRQLSTFLDPVLIAELMSTSTSLEADAEVYRQLLIADKPTNIPEIIDRTKLPYSKNSVMSFMKSLYWIVGGDIKYELPDRL